MPLLSVSVRKVFFFFYRTTCMAEFTVQTYRFFFADITTPPGQCDLSRLLTPMAVEQRQRPTISLARGYHKRYNCTAEREIALPPTAAALRSGPNATVTPGAAALNYRTGEIESAAAHWLFQKEIVLAGMATAYLPVNCDQQARVEPRVACANSADILPTHFHSGWK